MDTPFRTLPMRTEPIDGEALDSWLEAIAHRTHTAFADLLSAVGLSPDNGLGTSAWIVQLTPDEAEVISVVTGVADTTLGAMTLAHYSGRGVRINTDTRMLHRAFPWAVDVARGSAQHAWTRPAAGGSWRGGWAGRSPAYGTTACSPTHVHTAVQSSDAAHTSVTSSPNRGDARVPPPMRSAAPLPGVVPTWPPRQ
jgi:hypothetical protein